MLECSRGFLGFHVRRKCFSGYKLRVRIFLNGGRDGFKEIFNLVLDERVRGRGDGEVSSDFFWRVVFICFRDQSAESGQMDKA